MFWLNYRGRKPHQSFMQFSFLNPGGKSYHIYLVKIFYQLELGMPSVTQHKIHQTSVLQIAILFLNYILNINKWNI